MKFSTTVLASLASVMCVNGLHLNDLDVPNDVVERDIYASISAQIGTNTVINSNINSEGLDTGLSVLAANGLTADSGTATTRPVRITTTRDASKIASDAATAIASAAATAADIDSALYESLNAKLSEGATATTSKTRTKAIASGTTTNTKSLGTSAATGSSSVGDGILGTLLSNLNFEGIAGFLDNILSENEQYLDDVLLWLKRSDLLPKATIFLLNSNFSSPIIDSIASTVVTEGLQVLSSANTTTLFVALDNSGLAYQLVSQAILDPEYLPAVLTIAKKLIASGDLSFKEILAAAGRLVKKDESELEFALPIVCKRKYEERMDEDLEAMMVRSGMIPAEDIRYEIEFDKRDNIEDLFTTIFSSIERTGLLNTTIHELLVDPEFQDSAVTLLSGAFKKFASGSGNPTNLNIIGPIVAGAVESGILQHTFTRLLADKEVRAAIINDLGNLLRSGTAKVTDFISSKDVKEYDTGSYENLFAQAKVVALLHEKDSNSSSDSSMQTTLSSLVASATSSNASVASSATSSAATSSSQGAGNTISTNLAAGFAAFCGYILML